MHRTTNADGDNCCRFSRPEDAYAYILAGRAMVTLVSRVTGTRYTYKVTRSTPKPGDARPPVWFVSLMTGPDNVMSYSYVGIVTGSGEFRWTAKSRVATTSPTFKAFAWTWGQLVAKRMSDTLEIWHCGTCGRCGRPLTVPESIASGIGPVCAVKGTCTMHPECERVPEMGRACFLSRHPGKGERVNARAA